MKLYATITNSTPIYPNGKTVGLGHDNVLLIELKRGNKTIGRVKMECYINNGKLTAGREYDIKFFPVSTGKGGYILLHEEKVQAKKQNGETIEDMINFLYSHIEWEHISLDAKEKYGSDKLENLSGEQIKQLAVSYDY